MLKARSKQCKAVIYTALISTAALALPSPATAREPQRRQAQHERSVQRQHHYEWRNHRYNVIRRPKAPIRALPPSHSTVRIGKRHYYEYRGRYYRRGPSGYVVIAPPIGAIVATLPLGAVTLQIGGIGYFFAGGVYYRHHGTSAYIVVSAPIPPANTVDASAQQVIVQASSLNVRSGPGLDYSVITVLYHGDSLPVLGTAPGWYYIRLSNGQVGWVMSTYTVPVHISPEG